MWPYTDQETEFLAPPCQPRGELAARTLAMPADTNPAGDIFGGWIMSLMDAADWVRGTLTRQATLTRQMTADLHYICRRDTVLSR